MVFNHWVFLCVLLNSALCYAESPRVEDEQGNVVYRYCDPAARFTAPQLKILSYNIYLGGIHRKQNDGISYGQSFDRLMEVIQSRPWDVLMLQEVFLKASQNNYWEVAQVVAKRLKLCGIFASAADYGRFDYVSGRQGVLILSRYPFEDVAAFKLPAPQNSALWVKWSEQRSIAQLNLRTPYRHEALHLVNAHLSLVDSDRRREINWIKNLYGEMIGAPFILGGDMNFTHGSADFKRVLQQSDDRFSIGFKDANALAGKKLLPSYLSGDSIEQKAYEQIDMFFLHALDKVSRLETVRLPGKKAASDHLPLYIEIDLL